MHLAPSWDVCAGAVVLLAIVARAAKAVSWSGAVAGVAVGVAVSAGFGGPGLAVLGTFFVVGTAATKFGYAKKAARGAAQSGGGARGWQNVVGKGGLAAVLALLYASGAHHLGQPFSAALAAALADTLGTEVGTLAAGTPRSVPSFRSVPTGTPGAVSIAGTLAAAAGAAGIAVVADALGLLTGGGVNLAIVAGGGFAGCLAESLAVGLGLRAPGFIRNLLTTLVGAALGGFSVVS